MPKVKNLKTGASAECKSGENLREVAQKNNLGIPFGCENGICSTCLICVKKGAENLGPKSEQEEFTLDVRGSAPDMRLACQCQVNGDVDFEMGV